MNGLTRVLFFLVLLSARSAFALDPELHITELAHRVWDTRSGVPPDVRALAQTDDGYLWVGSLRGLYRFDGVHFQRFESADHAPSAQIRSLFAAPNNSLWIGYRTGGVSVLKAGKLINYDPVDGFPSGEVRGFAQDKSGRIWAAAIGGLAFFEDGRWHTASGQSNFPDTGAQAILVDHHGTLWVAGHHHIAVLGPHASKFSVADEPYSGTVFQLAEAPDGIVWMAETTRAVRPLRRPEQGAYQGITKRDCQDKFPETWQTEPTCHRPDDLEIRVGSTGILFDQDGSFWITTLGDGIRRAPYPSRLSKEPIGEFSNAIEQFTSKNGLSSDYARAILADREGNVWVATRDGIDQFRNSTWAAVSLGPAVAGLSIAPSDNGYVIATDGSQHLFRFHDGRDAIEVLHIDYEVDALYRDLFGSVWGTGPRGACRIVGVRCATRLDVTAVEGRPQFEFWRLAVDGDHRAWTYVPEMGLLRFEDGRWRQFEGTVLGLASSIPTTQYTDETGRVWFGLSDGRLLTVSNGDVRVYSSEDGLNVGEVKAVDLVGTALWVAGERGLALKRGERFTPVLPFDAPAFDSVSGLITADDGSLWLNESRGVMRLSASEVAAIVRDKSYRTHYDLLDSSDGLLGPTEQFHAPTAVRGSDGRLWFTTSKGAVWVDPQRFGLYRNKLPPPVTIQSIVADGRTFPPSDNLRLPEKTLNLQIAYAGLSLSVPERVQFRYRLKGLDHDWQDVGTRRMAYYTRPPPGRYEFQVVASNDAGVWNTVGAQLPIRILPAWYQTVWFYVLTALLIGCVLTAWYRLRLAQVRAETRRVLEARLSERERIARELHDTLLQGMQGLIWRFQAAADRIPPEQPARQLLEQSLDRADRLLGESRDKVKDLRPIANEAAELTQSLAAEGEQLAALYPAKFLVSVQGVSRDLHPIVREEAFLITREALSNAFRHSGAKSIEVEVSYGNAAFNIRVRDDGRGISGSVLEAGAKPGHFGLIGMRERARKLGGQLEVWSKPEAGTEIDLQVLARVAYRTSPLRSTRTLVKFFRTSRRQRKSTRSQLE